jgi:hypothetical protein
MKPKDLMLFLEGDDGGGFGGGGEADVSRGTAVFEGDQSQAAPETSETETYHERPPQAPAAPPQAPTVDARQLASEFGNVIGQHFRPPPKEITVEEAKKILNVWEPTREWLAKYDNLETRDQAIAEQRDGLIRQADTIMQYRMREMHQQMEQRYAPVIQYMQTQEARAGEWRFGQSYPQLQHQGLRPLLFSVAQSLLASGTQFRNEREMFGAIAKGVESVIKVSNPQFSLEAGGNGGNGGGQAVPARRAAAVGSIPAMTPGAGGGAAGPKSGPPKPRGLAIWD